MNQVIAHTGAMNGWQQQLGEVSSGVGNLISGAPGLSDVLNSHGTIGFPMQSAFESATAARGGAMGATQAASAKISDLLRQAAQAYERGDMAAADDLKKRAQQLEGAGASSAAGGGAAAGGAAAAAGSGGQAASPMMSQFGQMAGQMAQSITQPLQGMAQSLGQMPQQVFQGVQGIVQSATQAAGGGMDAAATAAAGGAGAEGAGTENAIKTGAPEHAGAGGGEGERAPVDAAGKDAAATERDKATDAVQVGARAEVGMPPEEEPGVGAVSTQIPTISPQPQ
ncbi:ESX-1 secretion-associated protein [Mycolicibacterium goodii]|uniref:ESX-1 secretion-associated protein n=1 Tax=Mycolicibacterium goodii TaxID=134601 RepID=A0ABS6HKP1_MYCGD|nr:ESX-1 secretion-associated protein [Mycolicibacterium goodii]MBU8823258.1 ESX-1 secretion-associated protein [Mycolicibacterium goodii]MBU8840702.1 ESX-1 secretion-associated protein [Mycolicibacterium goodii]